MAEKNMKARIVHKHDTEANWLKATNFMPMKGELIIYDIDANYTYERFKIGDGTHSVNELPFSNSYITDLTIDTICGGTIEEAIISSLDVYNGEADEA